MGCSDVSSAAQTEYGHAGGSSAVEDSPGWVSLSWPVHQFPEAQTCSGQFPMENHRIELPCSALCVRSLSWGMSDMQSLVPLLLPALS